MKVKDRGWRISVRCEPDREVSIGQIFEPQWIETAVEVPVLAVVAHGGRPEPRRRWG